MFLVVSVPHLTAESVGAALPGDLVEALAILAAAPGFSGTRGAQDLAVDALVKANAAVFVETRERIAEAAWYILSARRADALLRSLLFERVYALKVRGFAQTYRRAEVDMHFALATDLTPLSTFFEQLHSEGPTKVASLLERGTSSRHAWTGSWDRAQLNLLFNRVVAMSADRQMLQARTRSIDNLQRLYTFVISLAITESLRRLLILPDGGLAVPSGPQVLMFVSLVATIIPFYHGANRYLDATYVTGEQSAKPPALLVDFLFLFVEALWFFVLALSVGNEMVFYTGLGALLLFDVVWVWVTNLLAAGARPKPPHYVKWVTINVVAAAVIFVSVWSFFSTGADFWRDESARRLILTGVVVARTIFDYRLVWEFYYPPVGDAEGGQMAAPPRDRYRRHTDDDSLGCVRR